MEKKSTLINVTEILEKRETATVPESPMSEEQDQSTRRRPRRGSYVTPPATSSSLAARLKMHSAAARAQARTQSPAPGAAAAAAAAAVSAAVSKRPRERWLLTRKTWRYMADAGRRLIPDKHADVATMEALFQDTCRKQPKFLLWRKASYPGALRKHRRQRKMGGSCREKSTVREVEIPTAPPTSALGPLIVQPTAPGKFDLQKLRQEFLASGPGALITPAAEEEEKPPSPPTTRHPDDEELLLNSIAQYLRKSEDAGESASFREPRTAVMPSRLPSGIPFNGDHVQRQLLETLHKYYGRSTNRQKVISDLLTDRKLLEKLYFDLRRSRGFARRRAGPGQSPSDDDYVSSLSRTDPRWRRTLTADRAGSSAEGFNALQGRASRSGRPPASSEGTSSPPPPLIEVLPEVEAAETETRGTQTDALTSAIITAVEEDKKRREKEEEAEAAAAAAAQAAAETATGSSRRRSSVENDDVSPSVSDTIKRYLRMARKKSVDSDKVDRFKRVNYDRNLRNIRGKGVPGLADDDGDSKGAQTDEIWVTALKELRYEGTPLQSPKGLQSFLSHLLHGSPPDSSPVSPSSAGAMQKSKSSSSVVQSLEKIWRTRSKSHGRSGGGVPGTTCGWTPLGNCTWVCGGRRVVLQRTRLSELREAERLVLRKVALAKLQALHLGVTLRPPPEKALAETTKPKRRAYLLKRKALTTGNVDGRKNSASGSNSSTTGQVFGLALSQCVENEKAARLESSRVANPSTTGDEAVTAATAAAAGATLRRKSQNNSRASFSSLVEAPAADEIGSLESLISSATVSSIPGLLQALGGSTSDLLSESAPDDPGGGNKLPEPPPEPSVPHVVKACLKHLTEHGLNTLGIFRVSSSKKRVRQLREEFDGGRLIELTEDVCPHDAATLLKEYLRDLPDALLCSDLYPAFVNTQKIRNRRLQSEALQHLIQLLPPANRDTLEALVTFLAEVARNANDRRVPSTGEWIPGNRMDSSNLATLFAPNILHQQRSTSSAQRDELSAERVEERADSINVVRAIIDNCDHLFEVSPEILEEVYLHMMDSHPLLLDQLLQRRALEAGEDGDGSEQDATASAPAERRVWSRNQFLHERSAAANATTDEHIQHLTRSRDRSRAKRRSVQERRADVITASLTIPLMDDSDIPYIEDAADPLRPSSTSSAGSLTSPGGISRRTRSSSGSDSSWGSSPPLSPPPPPALAQAPVDTDQVTTTLQPGVVIQRVTFSTTNRDLPRSASATQVQPLVPTPLSPPEDRPERSAITPSISSIGGAVLRSKTADIERMLKISTTVEEDEFSKHKRRYLPGTVSPPGAAPAQTSPHPVWKRREIIASDPKGRASVL